MVKADGTDVSTSSLENRGGWYPYTVCKCVNPERWKGVVSIKIILFAHDVGYPEETSFELLVNPLGLAVDLWGKARWQADRDAQKFTELKPEPCSELLPLVWHNALPPGRWHVSNEIYRGVRPQAIRDGQGVQMEQSETVLLWSGHTRMAGQAEWHHSSSLEH